MPGGQRIGRNVVIQTDVDEEDVRRRSAIVRAQRRDGAREGDEAMRG